MPEPRPTYHTWRDHDDTWTGQHDWDYPTMNTPTIPEPITTLFRLIAQLPAGLRADWDGTNHYELTQAGEGGLFWLTPDDWTIEDLDSASEPGQRIGLLLDLAVAAKAAEAILHQRFADAP